MADHPLRPATDRRLGRPLPHQPANRTRAPPVALNLSPRSPRGSCGISRSFPRLSPTTGQVPTRYSPVRHSVPKNRVRLACVKHAASVRSEPGSNSHVQSHPEPSPREHDPDVTRAVTTLTHSRCRPISRQAAPAPRKQQRPAPPPAHPFLYPTMPINNPTPAAARSEAPAGAGGGL